MNDFVGTPYFIAPEILNSEKYGSKCDIWSLGVVTYSLLCGKYPFEGSDRNELYEKIKEGKVEFEGLEWAAISSSAKSFIKDCLVVNQFSRKSADELLNHDWIKMITEGHIETQEVKEVVTTNILRNLKSLRKTNSF